MIFQEVGYYLIPNFIILIIFLKFPLSSKNEK
jgi:hypothetical protein